MSEELYKALFNDLRADIREQLKALHNLPNGEEKALREAEVMMRVMKRIDMESVDAGKFDNAAALFGISRDYAVTDPVLGLANGSKLEPELMGITLGAYADAIQVEHGVTRKAACISVASMLPKSHKRAGRTIENWTEHGREGQANGRRSGYKTQFDQATNILKKSPTKEAGLKALEARIVALATRTAQTAEARKAFKTKR